MTPELPIWSSHNQDGIFPGMRAGNLKNQEKKTEKTEKSPPLEDRHVGEHGGE